MSELQGSGESPKDLSLNERLGQFAGQLSLTTVCMIPVADLATSDLITAKIYNVTQDALPATYLGHLVPDLAITAFGVGQSIALGLAIGRSKKLRGVAGDMEAYMEEKESEMSTPRRILSKVVNSPYSAIRKLSERGEKVGERVKQSSSKTVRAIGQTILEGSQVNAIGTSGMALNETLSDKSPSAKRLAWLSGLISATWVASVEGLRGIYEAVPDVRPALNSAVEVFKTLTTVDVIRPWETPVGSSAIALGAVALGSFAWHLSRFYEEQANEQIPLNP